MPIFGPDSINHYAQAANQQPAAQTAQAPAAKPSYDIGKWPYLTIFGSTGADIGTSLYDEAFKGTHEANPLGDGSIKSMLPLKIGNALMNAVIVNQLAKSGHPKAAKWASVLSSVPAAAGAIHNMMLSGNK